MTHSFSFFNSPFLSDVTIRQVSNGKKTDYHGHKAVLCAHSSFFLKLFSENPVKQENGNVIELHDDDPLHFQRMLKFLYTSVLETHTQTNALHLYTNPIAMYALAVKYGVEQLKVRAVAKFPSDWFLYQNVDWHAEVAEAHYSRCNEVGDQMGIAIARTFLRGAKKFVKSPKFQETIKKYPVLAADVLSVSPLAEGKLW
ncbi:uncharacterized protein N0V89_006584 [Didymosphaeria variabile]|uniref:BTB domain-containing protein n=1 Tax=Didymosphaeria variabile TaxID=1932322 RepID=A0A9W8XJU8_9PLEO|nr:uncharacterized protein N0V89_006584 [Didymosphaeria variabile]KAJ4351245.1 hypothetical protein N0V89_006584 [Didymosphaeria variabile]